MNFKNKPPESKVATIFLALWSGLGLYILISGLSVPFRYGGMGFVHNIPFGLFGALILYIGIRYMTFYIKIRDRLYNICQNPSEQTARAYIEYYRRRRPKILYAERNHPDNWNRLRDYWNRINRSNKIPTELKAEILGILKNDGLHVQNTIIDNYNK